jgi:hypothetical protein
MIEIQSMKKLIIIVLIAIAGANLLLFGLIKKNNIEIKNLRSNYYRYSNNWQNLIEYSTPHNPTPAIHIFSPVPNKKIIYVAVEHTSDLQDSIIKTITNIIDNEKIDLAILEGFNIREGINSPRVINISHKYLSENRCPENVYAAYLCSKNDIPFIGGDATAVDYLEPLNQKGFTEKDLVFFLLAQNFPIWNRDKIVNNDNFRILANDMLKNNISFWLERKINYTVDEFLKWHGEHLKKPLDVITDFPWETDRKEFMPSLEDNATIYQKIQAHIMPIRDTHIIRIIQKSLKQHDTLLVIFGASHYEWQKKALEFLFQKPDSTLITY